MVIDRRSGGEGDVRELWRLVFWMVVMLVFVKQAVLYVCLINASKTRWLNSSTE
jgi:hypothetical protein